MLHRVPEAVPQQRVGGLVEVPSLLRTLEVQPGGVLAAAGIAADALRDIEQRIPFSAATALLRESAVQARCPHFALLLGQRWTLAHFGALGELMRCSATVGEALARMAVYQQLNSDVGAMFLLQEGDTACIGYALYRATGPEASLVYDLAMAIAWNLLRELCGPRWAAAEVTFSRPEPADAAPYRQFFRVPLRFDRDHSAVHFSAPWLEAPLPGANPAACERLIESLESEEEGRLVPQVHRALRLLLLNGNSSGDELAQKLSLHRRTLNRRLRVHGTTFQKILDEVRFEVARQLLEYTNIPIGDIAAAVCYGEPSGFTHAFRRWSGVTPAAWRKRAQRH